MNQPTENSRLLPGQVVHQETHFDSIESFQPPHNFNAPKRFKRTRYTIIALISFLALALITTLTTLKIIKISQHSDELISNSVEMEVHNVSMVGLSTKGVKVRVQGITNVDYDTIDDDYTRALFKMGGGVLRIADIRMGSVALETAVEEKKVKIGTVDVPQMRVSIVQGGQTPVDMIVDIHPDTGKLLSLVKRILTHPEDILTVYGTTALNIALGGIPIGSFGVDFKQVITPNEFFQIDTDNVDVENILVLPEEDSYNISLAVTIPNPVKNKMISFEIPDLEWNILINDCHDNPSLPLLQKDELIKSKAFKLSSLEEKLCIDLSTLISQLNTKLNTPCPSEITTTPLKTLVNTFLKNNTLAVRVQNIGGSEQYPSFLNEILSKNTIDILYTSKSNASGLVHNSSLDNLAFDFQNGDLGSPIVNADVNIFLQIPVDGLESGIGVKQVRGLPKLYHDGEMFGQVEVTEWHECTNEFVEEDGVRFLHVSVSLKEEAVTITDSNVFAGVANEVLLGGGTVVKVKSDLDGVIETLIGDFEIDDIHVENESRIEIGS